jgi:hypothetical protein
VRQLDSELVAKLERAENHAYERLDGFAFA